jgi:hypothetical protein
MDSAASDMDELLKTQLLRISPKLQLTDADALIHEFACSCFEIHNDDQWQQQPEPPSSYAFCNLSDVGLAAILGQAELEVFAFLADQSLVDELDKALDRVEVFEQLVRSCSAALESRLTLKLPEARSWMEAHMKSNEAV